MRRDVCKGGSTSGRAETGIPKIPSTAPNNGKKWIFWTTRKGNSHGSKSCKHNTDCCSDTRLFSQEGRGGGVTGIGKEGRKKPLETPRPPHLHVPRPFGAAAAGMHHSTNKKLPA